MVHMVHNYDANICFTGKRGRKRKRDKEEAEKEDELDLAVASTLIKAEHPEIGKFGFF